MYIKLELFYGTVYNHIIDIMFIITLFIYLLGYDYYHLISFMFIYLFNISYYTLIFMKIIKIFIKNTIVLYSFYNNY